jgi:hypothetical protein
MDADLFESLAAQAREKGYLTGEVGSVTSSHS